MDRITKKQRSQLMSRIRGKNTSPEWLLRRALWAEGLRGYRVHSALKGKPDLYFGRAKLAVFVDGCFWHQCPLCYRPPKTNKKYWLPKIRRNVERDLETDLELGRQGIAVLRFWEHEVKKGLEKCVKEVEKACGKKP